MRTRAISEAWALNVLVCSILILDTFTPLTAQQKQESARTSKSLQVTGVVVAEDGAPLSNTTTHTYVFLVFRSEKNDGYGIALGQNERALNPYTETNGKGEFTLEVPRRLSSLEFKDFALVVTRAFKIKEGIEANLPMMHPDPSERRAAGMVGLVALGERLSCAAREGFPSSTLTFPIEVLTSRVEPIDLGQITLTPGDTEATVDCKKLTEVLNIVPK